MFCPRCGKENADSASFCKQCGNRLASHKVPHKAPEIPLYAIPQANMPLSSHPVLNAVKKTASSPLFLIAIIAYSIQLFFSFINVFNGGNILGMTYEFLDLVSEFLPYPSYELYELYNIVNQFAYIGDAPFIILGILGLIPTILICIGLWITYKSASNYESDGMSTSGLTVIKVLTIIQLISLCLSFVFTEFVLFVISISIKAAGYAPIEGIIVITVLLTVIIALVYVLQIIYFSKIIQSLNAVKYTVKTGVPSAKASLFIAVWNFISALCLFFALFANLPGNTAAITTLICFGILVFKFNSNMKSIPYSAPVENPVNQNV